MIELFALAEKGEVGYIYRRWIKENPKGMRELPRPASEIDSECIRRVVVEELLYAHGFDYIFDFLEDALTALGVEFFSPGGSIQRRVSYLLLEVFGFGALPSSQYLQDTAVRVGLDLLADEIEKRCQYAQPGAPLS